MKLFISLHNAALYGCPYCSCRQNSLLLSVIKCKHCNKEYKIQEQDEYEYPDYRKSVVFYSGSFDPITLGHLDIINRVSIYFYKLIVGIGTHPKKIPYFSKDKREQFVAKSIENLSNVSVVCHTEDPWEAARNNKASVLVRGLRNMDDFVHEQEIAKFHFKHNLDTLFLMSNQNNISSTKVKQMLADKNWSELSLCLPSVVLEILKSA